MISAQISPDPMPVATRRRLVLWLTASFGVGAVAATAANRIWGSVQGTPGSFRAVVDEVIPAAGVKTSIAFGDSIQKLIAAGALDPEKLRANFRSSIGLADWVERVLSAPSMQPILLSLTTAPYLLNLLWPLGLSTKATLNDESPLNTVRLRSFASTGGWTLGRERNGAAYFNQVEALRLTDAQDEMVLQIAKKVFRPCCDNSTLFQDCNHGSALLGLIELAASQSATAEELYRIALAANSYWFPDQYTKTALYFALLEGRPWQDVSPEVILGPRFSTLSGWQGNVLAHLRRVDYMSAIGRMGQGACAV